MATLDPKINPFTNEAFRENENPYDGSGEDTDPLQAKIKQEDLLASFQGSQDAAAATEPVVSPVGVTSEQNITGGSDDIRGTQDVVKSDGNKFLTELEAAQGVTQGVRDKELSNLQDLIAGAKELTDIDLKNIDSAGFSAGTEYDDAIARAKESKRQGMGKATVFAGERGGFLNTQFAGQAALQATEGGNFVGAGGELSKIKGQLDLRITELEAAKARAIESARGAARKAIRTGKREDLQDAQSIAEMAIAASEAQEAAVSKRIDVLDQLSSIQGRQSATGRAEKNDALEQLQTIASVGGEVPDEMRAALEEQFGEGFVDKYGQASAAAAAASDEASSLDAQEQIINMLKDIPQNKQIQIGDSSYEGLGNISTNVQLFKEVDNNGDVTIISFDKVLNEVVGQSTIESVGKTKTSSGDGSGDTGVSPTTADSLLASRGDDGFANTEVYQKAFDEAVGAGPKAVTNFFKQFPPAQILNPDDATALKFFQSEAAAIKDESGGTEEDLFSE